MPGLTRRSPITSPPVGAKAEEGFRTWQSPASISLGDNCNRSKPTCSRSNSRPMSTVATRYRNTTMSWSQSASRSAPSKRRPSTVLTRLATSLTRLATSLTCCAGNFSAASIGSSNSSTKRKRCPNPKPKPAMPDTTIISRVPAGIDLVEWYFEQGWTDGLPVVPPTGERVAACVAALGGEPQFLECRVPPRYGGGTPGDLDKSTLGPPGKYTYCVAENEVERPFAPYHVEKGFAPGDSTVFVIAAEPPP